MRVSGQRECITRSERNHDGAASDCQKSSDLAGQLHARVRPSGFLSGDSLVLFVGCVVATLKRLFLGGIARWCVICLIAVFCRLGMLEHFQFLCKIY